MYIYIPIYWRLHFFVPSNCWWHGLYQCYIPIFHHIPSRRWPHPKISEPRTPSHAGSTSSSPLHPAIARGGRPSTHLQRHGGPPDGCGVPSVIFEDLSCLKNIHGNMYLLEWMYICMYINMYILCVCIYHILYNMRLPVCLVDMNAIRSVFIGLHDTVQGAGNLFTTERHDANLHGLFATYQAFTLFAAGCDLRLRQIWPTEFRHPCSFYQEIQEVIVQRLGRRTQISAAVVTCQGPFGVGIPKHGDLVICRSTEIDPRVAGCSHVVLDWFEISLFLKNTSLCS